MNLLFIELLYKINITFVIMLILDDKSVGYSSCDINYMKFFIYIYIYIYTHIHLPHILNFVIILNAFY